MKKIKPDPTDSVRIESAKRSPEARSAKIPVGKPGWIAIEEFFVERMTSAE